mgnify:FL=1
MKKINLAIIPARSGSKGIKDKNILLINKKPLLAYTIESAIKSKCFDIIFVSTDSKKYAEIAKKYGANVDFLRSKKNSLDSSKSIDCILETVGNFFKKGIYCKTVTLLQPTSPLRDENDIKNAFKIFRNKKADSVISVCESTHPTFLYNTLKKGNSLHNFIANKDLHKLRQDVSKEYYVNGAIYILKPSNGYEYYGHKSYAYLMSKKHSVDINDLFDAKFAEFLLNNKY